MRSTDDARVHAVAITDAGRAVAAQGRQRADEVVRRLVSTDCRRRRGLRWRLPRAEARVPVRPVDPRLQMVESPP